VARQYVAADESATRADKTLRGMWCGGWSEWSAAREELWTDRSDAAHAKLEKWGPLLSLLEDAERKMKVA
jgi:phage terminase small subunit